MSIDDISDELLASFIDGRCRPAERVRVLHALEGDAELFETFGVAAAAAQLPVNENGGEPAFAAVPCGYDLPAGIAARRLYDNSSDREPVGDRCVICCEQMVLEAFGVPVGLDVLTALAAQQGWYLPGRGVCLLHVGNIVRHFGFTAERISGAALTDVAAALDKGAQVIVCLDGGELTGDPEWESYEDRFVGEVPDHASVVAGLERTGDSVFVLLRDPAAPDRCERYPLERFLDAWADGRYTMVVVKRPEMV